MLQPPLTKMKFILYRPTTTLIISAYQDMQCIIICTSHGHITPPPPSYSPDKLIAYLKIIKGLLRIYKKVTILNK